MSYAESPVETVKKFSETPEWKTASVDVLTNDFFCISNKTNLEWDPYVYEERNGVLFDPVREKPVVGSAGDDKVEEGINKQLEEWFIAHDSGIAVWISPRGGHWQYIEEKIAIHRIAYKTNGQKVLLCSSHQFQTEFRNPEDLRRFIFTEDDKEESVFEIIDWLKSISEKKVETSVHVDLKERKKQAEYYAYQYRSGVSIDQILFEMTQTKFLGENPIGCGGSNKSLNPENSTYSEINTLPFDYTETFSWHSGTCRVCGVSTFVGPCEICAPCASKM
jgi:hypothetical protein